MRIPSRKHEKPYGATRRRPSHLTTCPGDAQVDAGKPGDPCPPSLLRDAVLLEPRQQAFPAVLGLVLAVTGTIVRVETVRRVRVQDDLTRLLRVLARLAHPLDRLD